MLWLALRLGSVTINCAAAPLFNSLWLALRLGSVTIGDHNDTLCVVLWLALRLGSVTIPLLWEFIGFCCGLHSGSDQLQFKLRKDTA